VEQMVISPVQWASLGDIDEVRPVDESDMECFSEIREVLRRHGMMDRFGVALLHSHFDPQDDEVMLEVTDEESRTLITSLVRENEMDSRNVGTIWMLGDSEIHAGAWCRKYCERSWGILSGHAKSHARVNS
jgi:hypothetical protein